MMHDSKGSCQQLHIEDTQSNKTEPEEKLVASLNEKHKVVKNIDQENLEIKLP
jgi:hypothetical protein